MGCPPGEIENLRTKISEEEHEIQRKRGRLSGVGPVERGEIEKDIEAREGLVRDYINQVRVCEETPEDD
jgi:hypothetical protein